MASTRFVAEPRVPQVVITREFDAPREFLFRAHTDPDLLVQWFAPRGLTMTVDRFDLRDGGTWRYQHWEPDGTDYAFHGVFHGDPSPAASSGPSSSRAGLGTSPCGPSPSPKVTARPG